MRTRRDRFLLRAVRKTDLYCCRLCCNAPQPPHLCCCNTGFALPRTPAPPAQRADWMPVLSLLRLIGLLPPLPPRPIMELGPLVAKRNALLARHASRRPATARLTFMRAVLAPPPRTLRFLSPLFLLIPMSLPVLPLEPAGCLGGGDAAVMLLRQVGCVDSTRESCHSSSFSLRLSFYF